MNFKKEIIVERTIREAKTIEDIPEIFKEIQTQVNNQFGTLEVPNIIDHGTHWTYQKFYWNKPTEQKTIQAIMQLQANGTYKLYTLDRKFLINIGTNIIDRETGRFKKEFATARGFKIPKYGGGYYDYIVSENLFRTEVEKLKAASGNSSVDQ